LQLSGRLIATLTERVRTEKASGTFVHNRIAVVVGGV